MGASAVCRNSVLIIRLVFPVPFVGLSFLHIYFLRATFFLLFKTPVIRFPLPPFWGDA